MCAHRPSKPGPPKIFERCKTEMLDLWLRYLTAAVLIYPGLFLTIVGLCKESVEYSLSIHWVFIEYSLSIHWAMNKSNQLQTVSCYRYCPSHIPGLSRTRTKNRKKGESLVKFITWGRDNLITCGQTKELAHALWTEYTRSVATALWPTEWD